MYWIPLHAEHLLSTLHAEQFTKSGSLRGQTAQIPFDRTRLAVVLTQAVQ